ncbi:hypothetical protein PG996_008107 [Apiospora saccharicola]|uniref:Uncharacterized protein n=1 Tax=Apiospora saccharicola TaxID=335842 RepID=A0ABR1UZG9_9PEZI
MANANAPTELSRKFAERFGAEYAKLFTPSEIVDLVLDWGVAWHKIRTRNICTLVRDYPGRQNWFKNEYVTEGYLKLVEDFNVTAHSYDLRGDMMLLPINLHFNKYGVPALQALFEDLYFISDKDLFDLYRFTQDKSEVTGRPTEGAKLFCYMANYLEEYFNWREDVRGLLAVYTMGQGARFELQALGGQIQAAIEVMKRAIGERRSRGPGVGPSGMQVPWHWSNLRNATKNLNQEVMDLTLRHNFVDIIRQIRRGTLQSMVKATGGFPTKSEVDMQQPPKVPSLMGTAASSSSEAASGGGTQAGPSTPGNAQPKPPPPRPKPAVTK